MYYIIGCNTGNTKEGKVKKYLLCSWVYPNKSHSMETLVK